MKLFLIVVAAIVCSFFAIVLGLADPAILTIGSSLALVTLFDLNRRAA